MYKLGERLRELRGSLSLREVANRSHGKLSHTTIAHAERGTNSLGRPFTPSAATLQELSKLYGADINELFDLAGYAVNVANNSNEDNTIANETVKVYGEIRDGADGWSDQNVIGEIPITKDLADQYGTDNLFALRVTGNAMNKKIPSGFAAVFCKDVKPQSGDIVAAVIDHDAATVTQYDETSKAIIFSPMSYDQSFQPCVIRKSDPQNFDILGKYLFATDQNI